MAEVEKIKFLSTNTLFTTPPPPDSSDWVNDKKYRKSYLPLIDGRITQFLSNKFKSFFKLGDDARAARYNPMQFRVRIEGMFKIKYVKIFGRQINTDTLVLSLDTITADTPLGEKTYKKEDLVKLKKIKIENIIKSKENVEESYITKKEIKNFFKNIKTYNIDNKEKLDEIIDRFYEKSNNIRIGKTKLIEQIINCYSFCKDENFSENSINYFIDKNINYKRDFDLSRYIKKLFLIEDKKSAAKKDVGKIIAKLNRVIMDYWFNKPPSITASYYSTIFDDQLFEFFETENAYFTPTSVVNELDNNDQGKRSIIFEGQITCGGYLWLDARLGEGGILNNKKWTFRIHDDPNKVIATF